MKLRETNFKIANVALCGNRFSRNRNRSGNSSSRSGGADGGGGGVLGVVQLIQSRRTLRPNQLRRRFTFGRRFRLKKTNFASFLNYDATGARSNWCGGGRGVVSIVHADVRSAPIQCRSTPADSVHDGAFDKVGRCLGRLRRRRRRRRFQWRLGARRRFEGNRFNT